MIKKAALQKSRLFVNIAAHPYLSLAAVFFFLVGIASGISTNSGMAQEHFVASAAQWMNGAASYGMVSGLLRAALLHFLLFALLCSAAFFKPLFVLSCLAMVIKGFFVGFAAQQLLYEYGGWGAFYVGVFVALPLFFTGTALFLCFLWAGTAVFRRGASTADASALKGGMEKEQFSQFLRNAFLLCMGIAVEGVLVPLLFRLFSGLMAAV